MEEHERTSAYQSGWATHPGLVRAENEDNCLARPAAGLWVVSDGMGGHEAGAYASEVIVKALASIAAEGSLETLQAAASAQVLQANATILDFASQNGGITVGSTVAMLILAGQRYAATWCGDSRIYRIRRNAIELISHDHTAVQEFIDQGVLTVEEGKVWPKRNVLTRAIGVGPDPAPDTCEGDLEDGDVFVLCSDGLTGHVEDDEILMIAKARPAAIACEDLIDMALARGGKDNVTVIVVQFRPNGTRRIPRPPLAQIT